MQKTFTPKELSTILHMHPKTVQEKIRKGEIKGVKLGKQWIVTEEEVERLLKEGERR